MTDTLPLAGDGDEVDLIVDVQRAFGVELDDQELVKCETVGELYQLLLITAPHAERAQSGCLAAKAFFKLRRAIESHQPGFVIRPGTDLVDLTGRVGVNRWARRVELRTGLELPSPTFGLWADGFLVGSIGFPIASGFALGWKGLLVALPVAVSFLVIGHWLGRFRKGIATVGDLSREVSALNLAKLTNPNSVVRTREIWPALQAVIRSSLGWDGEVNPGTRFFRAKA
jgi:hypothetical protein